MVYHTMKRDCAYSGVESTCQDKALPSYLGEDVAHNWVNSLPCSIVYKESKAGELPTDQEAEIHETFYLLELARWKVKYLELKLAKLQKENTSRKPQIKTGVGKKNKEKKKDKEIEAARAIHDVMEDNGPKIDEFLTSKKKSIF